jgi:glycosyltransferase involved in cell wall biosynthesis
MHPAVALDLTRLCLAPLIETPRGIERVEYAYARYFLQRWPGDCVAVVPTPWGLRWFDRRRALTGLELVDEFWRENEPAEKDAVYRSIKSGLSGRNDVAPRRFSIAQKLSRVAHGNAKLGIVPGHSVTRKLPAQSVFLTVGQTGLSLRSVISWLPHSPDLTGLSWLTKRPDVTAVFMVHDAIPVEFPQYVETRAQQQQRVLLASVARFAKGVIVPSAAAGQSVARQLEIHGRKALPMLAAHLPVPDTFLSPEEPDHELGMATYFVACGAWEPRKNYALLLNVWRQLVERLASRIPYLVIVGANSARDNAELESLYRNEQLRRHVIHASGLSTPGLKQVLQSCRGLLMPSFAEGFGLPIIEALALGRPVIASDLPAHREAGGTAATYIDPRDETGWRDAILALSQETPRSAATAGQFKITTTASYFEDVSEFLQSLANAG